MKSAMPAIALFLVFAMPFSAGVNAQDYPAKSIRIVVPFPPGGPVDTLARLFAEKLRQPLGQTLVVENRAGASGSIGAAAVARSPADGYTLLISGSSYAMDPAVRSDLPFDPRKDLHGVSMLASGPVVLLATKNVPASNVQQLIGLLKKNPDKYSYASIRVGTVNYFAAELFKRATGTKMLHVPYSGAAPATQAILAAEVDLFFNNVLSSLPQINAGKVKALAVTSSRRWPSLPDLPTLAESGVSNFEIMSWYGVFAPANTLRPVLDKLSAEIKQVLNDPDTEAKINQLGLEGKASSPDEFQAYIGQEIDKWTEVVRNAGIKAE